MTAVEETKPNILRFPEAGVRSALMEFWNKEAKELSDDPFTPAAKETGSLYDLFPALDSLTIVRSLLVVEKVMKMKVPVQLVKQGGYQSRQEMLDDMLPKLRSQFEKRQTRLAA